MSISKIYSSDLETIKNSVDVSLADISKIMGIDLVGADVPGGGWVSRATEGVYWTAGEYSTWNIDHWEAMSYGAIELIATAWWQGKTPTKIKVTANPSYAKIGNLGLINDSFHDLARYTDMIEGSYVVELDVVPVGEDDNDIKMLNIYSVGYAPISLVNIEFYEE